MAQKSKPAALAILVKEGDILPGKRSPFKRACANQWDIIGGHVEEGEVPDQALVREVNEEIGVSVREFIQLQIITEHRPEFGGPALFHAYLISQWVGEIEMLGTEHVELRWFSIREACTLSDLAHPDYRELFSKIKETTGLTDTRIV